jgi:hypothetical protein
MCTMRKGSARIDASRAAHSIAMSSSADPSTPTRTTGPAMLTPSSAVHRPADVVRPPPWSSWNGGLHLASGPVAVIRDAGKA